MVAAEVLRNDTPEHEPEDDAVMSPALEHLYEQGEINLHQARGASLAQLLIELEESIDPPGEDPDPERSLKARRVADARAKKPKKQASATKDKRPKARTPSQKLARDMSESARRKPAD